MNTEVVFVWSLVAVQVFLTDSAGVDVEVYIECCWFLPVVAMETVGGGNCVGSSNSLGERYRKLQMKWEDFVTG